MNHIPLDPFIDGLRQTADFLNDAVFSDDIAAMRDALELGRNNLRGAADKLGEVAGNYEKVNVRRLYNIADDDKYADRISNYMPMLYAFGYVAVAEEIGSYHGDMLVLYTNNGRYGYLCFGYGSCCGCDMLQACNTPEDVQEVCDHLQPNIRWFDTAEEIRDWLQKHDWDGDYICEAESIDIFLKKAYDFLASQTEDRRASDV